MGGNHSHKPPVFDENEEGKRAGAPATPATPARAAPIGRRPGIPAFRHPVPSPAAFRAPPGAGTREQPDRPEPRAAGTAPGAGVPPRQLSHRVLFKGQDGAGRGAGAVDSGTSVEPQASLGWSRGQQASQASEAAAQAPLRETRSPSELEAGEGTRAGRPHRVCVCVCVHARPPPIWSRARAGDMLPSPSPPGQLKETFLAKLGGSGEGILTLPGG